MEKIKLPKEGIFVGSGVYPTDTDTLLCTMLGHYSWQCQYFSPMEMIDKIIEDNQGNLAQVWGYARGFSPRLHGEWLYALDEIGINIPAPDWENYKNLTLKEYKELFEEHKDRFGEGIVRFIREAKKRGIYTALIYTDAAKGVPPKMCAEGEWYLGYDFGERYNIGLSEAKKILEESGSLTLSALAASLTRRVKEHCDERRESGWGHIMATSANFSLDYEILGGADIPVVEDFAFPNLNFASGYSRGLYRQHDLPLWGSHLAHEHYSWLPCKDPRRLEELKAGMYLKYMAGSKMIINESGNWFVEHTLSPDSPKFNVPQTAREKFGILGWGDSRKLLEESPEKIKPLLEEARPYFKDLDYNSEVCRGYRRVISEFWDFVKTNGTPEGQPDPVYVPVVIKPYEDKPAYIMRQAAASISNRSFVINPKSENIEAIAKLLDWTFSGEFIQLGEAYHPALEGITWKIDPETGYEVSPDPIEDNFDNFAAVNKKTSGFWSETLPRNNTFTDRKAEMALKFPQINQDFMATEYGYLYPYTLVQSPETSVLALATEDEAEIVADLKTDLITYMTELTIKLVLGEKSMDNWDSYMEDLENLGVEDVLEVFQARYERAEALKAEVK